MAKSSQTFNKRENEKKRIQKRKDKEQKREERKATKEPKSFEDMLAYVDENGNFSSTPPDLTKKRVIKETEIDLTSRNKGGAGLPFQHQGFIKYFDSSKGFGFIKDSQTGEEFFFHQNSANFPAAQNDRVTFDTQMGPKGPNAVKVAKITG